MLSAENSNELDFPLTPPDEIKSDDSFQTSQKSQNNQGIYFCCCKPLIVATCYSSNRKLIHRVHWLASIEVVTLTVPH